MDLPATTKGRTGHTAVAAIEGGFLDDATAGLTASDEVQMSNPAHTQLRSLRADREATGGERSRDTQIPTADQKYAAKVGKDGPTYKRGVHL